jgi:hypothetical protein
MSDPSQTPEPTAQKSARSPRRFWAEVLLGFFCVFGGLALPARGLGPYYVAAHVALGNAFLEGTELQSHVRLGMVATREQLATDPWQATLVIAPPGPALPVRVPIDLRVLAFLPTAAFIALAAAVPLGSLRRHVVVLAVGLPLLELLVLALMAAPMLSFLGGTGPVQAIHLGRATHTLLQIVYRAFVVPPGMTFAVPLLLWYALATWLGKFSFRNSNA